MSKLIADEALQAKLKNGTGVVQICDDSGRTLGYYHPVNVPRDKMRSPLSDEELERRRREKPGRPLADILRDLNRS